MSVVEQAVEHGADRGRVAQPFSPVFHRSIGGQHGAGAFVAAHDDLQQFFGGGKRQLAHAQIVDDEQGDGHQEVHLLFARAIECGVGEIIEQSVGFAVDRAIALLDSGLADGLRQVTFPTAGRP